MTAEPSPDILTVHATTQPDKTAVIDARPGGQNRILGINPDVGFGATWKASYEADSWNETLAHQVARVKKAYPWGMLGDWTLRLDY